MTQLIHVPENPTVEFYLNETEWSREGEDGTALTPTQKYKACEHIHEFITAMHELTGTRSLRSLERHRAKEVTQHQEPFQGVKGKGKNE